jgi:hypothetical protein
VTIANFKQADALIGRKGRMDLEGMNSADFCDLPGFVVRASPDTVVGSHEIIRFAAGVKARSCSQDNVETGHFNLPP